MSSVNPDFHMSMDYNFYDLQIGIIFLSVNVMGITKMSFTSAVCISFIYRQLQGEARDLKEPFIRKYNSAHTKSDVCSFGLLVTLYMPK